MNDGMEQVVNGISNLIEMIAKISREKCTEMSEAGTKYIDTKDPSLITKVTELNRDIEALIDLGEGIADLFARFEHNIRPI